ncbi:MAG: NAD(P)-dependent alcohol dehydrogenase [Deltaproteobacteria bacterium]|nr:NAD(P)-dependent alcohol dehydrogenase [Deltaproteobacteria bacterium]
MTVKAYAAMASGKPLEPFEYEPGDIGEDQVDIDVSTCGICHSDLSMLDNNWEITEYPIVPGHEISGTIRAVGKRVTHLTPGQKVGLGWFAQSCMTCRQCLSGNHNLCADAVGTIVGRHGGFADRVRAHKSWVIPLPAGIDTKTAGPLFCGGITVFNPIVQNNVRPTDRVAVVGIGGLGHMALKFLKAWGCEVTAFSTSPDKESAARDFGAHHFVNTTDSGALAKLAGRFDMILVTVNVALDWDAYIAALSPKGKLHIVGAAPSVNATVFPMIIGQRSFGGSPLGSPATMASMLEFAARHGIGPVTEAFPMSTVNDAIEKLRTGKPGHRIVLENDF